MENINQNYLLNYHKEKNKDFFNILLQENTHKHTTTKQTKTSLELL